MQVSSDYYLLGIKRGIESDKGTLCLEADKTQGLSERAGTKEQSVLNRKT